MTTFSTASRRRLRRRWPGVSAGLCRERPARRTPGHTARTTHRSPRLIATVLDPRLAARFSGCPDTTVYLLSVGVAPPQVAEWAGHSVDVLLRVYTKCISGKQDEAKRRILEATRPDDSTAENGPDESND